MKRPIVAGVALIQNPNRGTGHKGKLLYELPEDHGFLFKLTQSSPTEKSILFMGRVTFDSIPEDKHAFPGRDVAIITKNPLDFMVNNPGKYAFNDPQQGLAWVKQHYSRIWIWGGESIYRKLLIECEELYLTEVQGGLPSDRFFPDFMDAFSLTETLREGTSLNRASGAIAIPVPYKIRKYKRNA